MNEALSKLIQDFGKKVGFYVDLYKDDSDVSYAEHVKTSRKKRSLAVAKKRIVYLDTLAWKCLADHKQGKLQRFTGANFAFVQAMEDARKSGNVIFPIGLSTFFELDSMTDPKTSESLISFVDQLCLGFCVAPFAEVLQNELNQALSGNLSAEVNSTDYLVSPIELMGIPGVNFKSSFNSAESLALNKALFDVVSQLPFSAQLMIARDADGPKWNNSRLISELNEKNVEHRVEIANFNTAVFLELKGLIETCLAMKEQIVDGKSVAALVVNIMYFWKTNPQSKGLSSMRVLSGLHSLFRFDKQRKYQSGDLADFMAAASALPMSKAMFTDRRLAIILSEKLLGFKTFSTCDVVSGFDEMASYLIRSKS